MLAVEKERKVKKIAPPPFQLRSTKVGACARMPTSQYLKRKALLFSHYFVENEMTGSSSLSLTQWNGPAARLRLFGAINATLADC